MNMSEQDAAREAYRAWVDRDPISHQVRGFDVWLPAWTAGVAHGRAEALAEVAAMANRYYEQAMLDPDSPTGTALFGEERAIRQAVYDVRAAREGQDVT